MTSRPDAIVTSPPTPRRSRRKRAIDDVVDPLQENPAKRIAIRGISQNQSLPEPQPAEASTSARQLRSGTTTSAAPSLKGKAARAAPKAQNGPKQQILNRLSFELHFPLLVRKSVRCKMGECTQTLSFATLDAALQSRRHINAHCEDGRHQCGFEGCTKGTTEVHTLERHVMTTHLKLKYACPSCRKSFSRVAILKNHVKSAGKKTSGGNGGEGTANGGRARKGKGKENIDTSIAHMDCTCISL